MNLKQETKLDLVALYKENISAAELLWKQYQEHDKQGGDPVLREAYKSIWQPVYYLIEAVKTLLGGQEQVNLLLKQIPEVEEQISEVEVKREVSKEVPF